MGNLAGRGLKGACFFSLCADPLAEWFDLVPSQKSEARVAVRAAEDLAVAMAAGVRVVVMVVAERAAVKAQCSTATPRPETKGRGPGLHADQ